MTNAEILALVNAKAAIDPAFAALVAARNDTEAAASLSASRTKRVSKMLTKRGIISVLGLNSPQFLKALRAFSVGNFPSGSPIPADNTLKPYSDLAAEIVPYLDGTDGVDVGDALTQQLLKAMASAGILDAASVDTVCALANQPDPITIEQLGRALNSRSV